jgi:glycine dehydrogenase subunit 1
MPGYIPHTKKDIEKMKEFIGIDDIDELFSPIPEGIRENEKINIPDGVSEIETYAKLKAIASKNKVYSKILRGAGAYSHYIPPTVKSLATRSEFLTAYTPYQPEISQGILQTIFEYQTMICELTGLDVSNASVYDGATACAEAAVMCLSRKRGNIAVSAALNPQTIKVLETWGKGLGVEIKIVPLDGNTTDITQVNQVMGDDCAALIMQSPNYFGVIEDMQTASDTAHGAGGYFIASVNPISLMLFKAPGEYGADIAVGDGQPLGSPLGYGGPYLGFMAATGKMTRKLPGRIVGQTTDRNEKRSFVLTLQAREQHIRREKASSNICSNQAHSALLAAIYMAYMGRQGMYDVAKRCYDNAHYLKQELSKIDGVAVSNDEFFCEFVTAGIDGEKVNKRLKEENVLGPLEIDGGLLWCATELLSKKDIDKIVELAKEAVI